MTPIRVLVVDDEENIAELLRMALRYEGWDVEVALTGSRAVAAAKRFRPDSVVLDMMLPDFDGLEVLRRMRAHVAPSGRAAIGFGAGRGYEFDDFLADARAVGWAEDLLLSTWDLRPFTPDADFLVAVLRVS